MGYLKIRQVLQTIFWQEGQEGNMELQAERARERWQEGNMEIQAKRARERWKILGDFDLREEVFMKGSEEFI